MGTLIQSPPVNPTLASSLNMMPRRTYTSSHDESSSTAAKSRNACDECRARKLKCSGEPTGCSRCKADRVACRYSPRKQMGRPRKKRTEDETQQQEYEAWSAESAGGGFGASMAPAHNSLMYANPNDYNGNGASAIGSPNLDFDFSNMGMPYMNPPTSDINMPSTSVAQMDLPHVDFSAFNFPTSPNLSNDYTWGNTPNYAFPSSSQHPPSSHRFSPSLPTPPIATASQSPSQTCRCLPHLYKTLQHLPAYISTPTFPRTLQPLRRATQTTATLLHCHICPHTYASALQNSMGAVTLLNIIVLTYHKLLRHIDTRADSERKIKFRFGEMTPNGKGHTGPLDCPMGIEVDLSGSEWRTFARKAVRKEVLGDDEDVGGGGMQGQSLLSVLEGLKERQSEWHGSQRFAEDIRHQHQHDGQPREKCICVQGIHFEQLIQQAFALGL